jgi:endonuclease YncB( thermonuclease family)
MNELNDPDSKREKNTAKIGLLLLAVALVVGFSAYMVLPEARQCYTVKRVIDGDTIQLSVKYAGIDTPETVHPSMPVEWYGKEASEFNKKLVEGKEVYLELDVEQKDVYNRVLAYVYLADGTFVNSELVGQGYARVSRTYPPDAKYERELLALEQEAREARRGLWAHPWDVNKDGRVGFEDVNILSEYLEDNVAGYSESDIDVNGDGEVNMPDLDLVREHLGEDYWEYNYVASIRSEVFHRPSCYWVRKIAEGNRIYFRTLKEAMESGRRPCRVCKPER